MKIEDRIFNMGVLADRQHPQSNKAMEFIEMYYHSKKKTNSYGQNLRMNLITHNWLAHIVAFLLNIEVKEMYFSKSNELISIVVLITVEKLLEIGNLLN